MGLVWYVFLEHDIADYKPPHIDGKALASAVPGLNKVCDHLKLPRLETFLSDVEDEPVWFDPAKALPSLRGLLVHLREKPGCIPRQTSVIAELADTENILQTADNKGVRFSFSVY
jgi:hypothetical protein